MKNIFKYIPVATLGQILGTAVAFPSLIFLINIFYFSNKYNDVTEQNADAYIRRSVIKEIAIPAHDSGKYTGERLVEHLSHALNAQSDGLSNTLIANTIIFFCDKYQEYFTVICLKDYSIDDWENERVFICVNKDEMLNLQYGTKDNPISILQVKGIDKSIRVNNLDFDKSYMDKFYVYNVIQYLKYRMPKDEFERRFSGNEQYMDLLFCQQKSVCSLFMERSFKHIPMVLAGQIIGGVLVVPPIYFLINKLYFPYKYNDNVEVYAEEYIKKLRRTRVYMNGCDPKMYLSNLEPETKTLKAFMVKMDGDYFVNPEAHYIPFYSPEYKKYFSIMYFDFPEAYDYDNKEVYLTVNEDEMSNPAYGVKGNPVPVLKMVGVRESIRDNDRDYDQAYMDSFYHNNIIRYLKYKMSEEEFKRHFKNKE